MAYVVRKFTKRSGIKGYHILITGAKRVPNYDTDKTQEKETSTHKLLKFTSYNELIIS